MAIPAALAQAFSSLVTGLRPAMESYRQHGRFPDPQGIVELVESFYFAIGKLPFLRAELSKRAELYHLQIDLPPEQRTVRLEYEHLQVEGCWYILHVGRGDAAEEWDAEARALLTGDTGGAQLEVIGHAAEVLTDFAEYVRSNLRGDVSSASTVARDQFKWFCGEITARLDEADTKGDTTRLGDVNKLIRQLHHAAAACGFRRSPIKLDSSMTHDGKLARGIWLIDPDGARGSHTVISVSDLDDNGQEIGWPTIWGGKRGLREIRAAMRECLRRWIRWVERPGFLADDNGGEPAGDGKQPGGADEQPRCDYNERLTVPQLAERYGLDERQKRALSAKLGRWRRGASIADYGELQEHAKNEPKYLYRVGAIRHLLG